MTNEPIRSVAIVGGGTAGWMSAATLSQSFPHLRGGIRLIESEAIGTVGVGEATIPPIIDYIRTHGIDEDDLVRRTQATFKLGIEFKDWTRPGHSYIHPFGPTGLPKGGVPFYTYWHRCALQGTAAPLEVYSLQAVAARQDKFMRPVDRMHSPLATIVYALHLDARLFAGYLRAYAEARGVVRTEGKVRDVALRSEDGFIKAITLESGERIDADLYIDCTGFRGLLIEEALKTGYEDWTHWLPCDRAVAVPCERTGPLSSHTMASAREVGWQWRIPLQHRVGNGYVYSSQFLTDDAAQEILLANLEGAATREPLRLRFTAGRRKQCWSRNCVAIGLSAGFLEPLESTGIHLIQRGIFVLLKLFPDRHFRQQDIDQYNRQLAFDYERARDFIVAHYHFTEREGGFWRYCRSTALPESLRERIELFRNYGRLLRDENELFSVQSWFHMLIGQGVKTAGYDPFADSLGPNPQAALDEIQQVVAGCASTMPSHEAFIERHCRAASQ